MEKEEKPDVKASYYLHLNISDSSRGSSGAVFLWPRFPDPGRCWEGSLAAAPSGL